MGFGGGKSSGAAAAAVEPTGAVAADRNVKAPGAQNRTEASPYARPLLSAADAPTATKSKGMLS